MSGVTNFLERYFLVRENRSDLRTEARAGVVTFLTMSYIIFVQPAVLGQAGMDFGAVMAATCIASFVGCMIMGLAANYPIALAPGMGINFYFTYTVVLGEGMSWQQALGAVFISGIVLILLTVFKIREMIINVIPDFLKNGIAVGIGLFIAFIGFVQGGIVEDNPGSLVQLGRLASLPALFTFCGLVLIAILLQRGVKGAILIGMLVMSVLGIPLGVVEFKGIVALPPDIAPTLFKLDIRGAWDMGFMTIAAVFVFVDLFDTAGTLVGVGQQGGFIRDGKLPRANRALLPDAVATAAGALAGTSTVTCYIESAAGVAEGGRTGLAGVVAGLLFLLALLFSPVAHMIGGGYVARPGVTLYPITAPVMIIVGCMMAANVTRIDWRQWDEALPSFLILIGMPLTYSIADGMALGFVSYPLIKIFTGKGRDVHWCLYLIALVFALRYGTA
jgi:AGZA family xanthine/uracil permease-like MFS transporter